MIPIDDVVFVDCITSTPATSAAVDADSAPTFDVFEEDTDTPILAAQTMVKRTSKTGNYRGSITASAANGFEAGKWYSVVASGIVGGVTGKNVIKNFRVAPAETSAGVPQVRASAIADGAISAPTLASDTLTAAKLASDVGSEIAAAVRTELTTELGRIDAAVTTRATPAQVNTEADTALADVGLTTTITGRIDAAVSTRATPAQVNTEADTALADYDGPTNAELTTALAAADDAVLTAVDALPTNAELATALAAADDATLAAITAATSPLATAANLATVAGYLDTEIPALTAAMQGLMLASGTIGATGNDTTHLHLSGLAYADDAINSMLITIKDVSTGLFYSRWVEDFANTGDLVTVGTLPFTPEASVDLYWILPVRADVTGGSGLDAAGVRAAIGLASANMDTQLGDLPTNAELATALASADDAVLAAVAALNNLSAAGVRTAIGMASANLDTQLGDLPTNAELATALGTADDAVLAAVAALNNLSQAQVRTAVGLASANLDTQLDALPTNTELATALGTADDAVLARLGTPAGASVSADIAAVKTDTGTVNGKLDTIDDFLDTEIAAIVAALTGSTVEPTAIAAQTASLAAKINTMYQLAITEQTQTLAGARVVKKSTGQTVGTATNSDDGTTFTRGLLS